MFPSGAFVAQFACCETRDYDDEHRNRIFISEIVSGFRETTGAESLSPRRLALLKDLKRRARLLLALNFISLFPPASVFVPVFHARKTPGSFLIRRSRRRCIRPVVRSVRFPFIRVHPPEVGRPPCVGETEKEREREETRV